MAEKIIERNVLDAYKRDMTVYAIATNRRRSVPEVKDGLKLVARRILTAMFFDKKCYSNRPTVKCAGIVGSVMQTYHPHGDSSIYDTLVGMATWYNTKLPLAIPGGNFGNMQGDGAAAMRYTSSKLSKFTEDCVISELRHTKGVVDWARTFDDANLEPEYLPVAVPLLLVNGTYGIGVGLTSSVPSHNLGEVIDATINLIRNPDAPVVLIPDQNMACNIIDTNWKAICNNGNGKYRARAVIDIETVKDIPQLVIKSIPDMVTLINAQNKGIIPSISAMVKDGKLPQITRLVDDSSGADLRYIIELKKGSDPIYVRDYLYKHTNLQKTFTINFEVMDGIEPLRLSYKAYLQHFIEFRRTTKFRLYTNLYQDVKTKWKEKQLYLKVMKSNEIDNIISKIRKLKKVDNVEFMEYLIKTLNVTDLEAKYLMNMNVMRLSEAYYNQYIDECRQYEEDAKVYLDKITNDDIIDKEIIDDLLECKRLYDTPRKCKVIKEKDDLDIPKGEFKIVITENNFIKKISLNENITSYRGDKPKFIINVADNTEYILLFDKNGKVFKYPIWKIPLCDKNPIGIDIRILIKNLTSDIISMIYEPILIDLSKRVSKQFLVTVTENNYVKKMDLEDFLTVTASGIYYTRLNENDFVRDISIVSDKLDLIIYSRHKALRLNMTEIPHYKRTAIGVSAMNTKEQIDGISVIYPDVTHIIVVTESGRINKFDVAGLARSNRNKAGSSVIKLGKTDSIVSIHGVNDSNVLKVYTRSGIIDINISDIKVGSSVSSGVKMIALKGDNIIKTKIYK